MADEGTGKKVGVIGGIVAAIGAVFAHGADDCARIGAKSVAFESAGVRAGSEVGKDFGRLGVRAGAAAERPGLRGATELGELRGASEVAEGRGVKFGAGVAADDVAHGSKWEDVVEELCQDVVENGLDYALNQPDTAGEDSPPPTFAPPRLALGPAVLALMPRGLKVPAFAFGERSRSAFLVKLALPTRESARFVIGYVASDNPQALVSPDGPSLPLAEIFARSVSARVATFVLACDGEDYASAEPCAVRARAMANEVLEGNPTSAQEAGRRLLEARKTSQLETLVVSSVARVGQKRRILSSHLNAK